MKKYKLTTQGLTTHNGFKWEVGKKHEISRPGNALCSDQVLHYYDSPELAALLNPIHSNYSNPRLFEIECDSVAHDGLKGGSKHQTLIREIPLPAIDPKSRVVFAVLAALDVYVLWAAYDTNHAWRQWAENFLSGHARATESATRSATRSAELAARAARSAELATAELATARAAELAARSAELVAWSTELAARAATRSAELVAESAAELAPFDPQKFNEKMQTLAVSALKTGNTP